MLQSRQGEVREMARLPTFAEIGERIRALRQEGGYDQADLAETLQVSRPVITKIEGGKKAVNSLELRKIADFLGVSVDELTRPVEEEETLVARFRAGKDDPAFLEAVGQIEGIMKMMIAQLQLRRERHGKTAERRA
jgi:transcriptional regulator with XRE-family HTH domain